MFGIVIDSQGFKVEFVVLNEDKSPQFYELNEGETIIETGWQIANGMNKPKWNGSEWIDTEPLPPIDPPIPQPSLTDKISILEADVTAQTLENQAQASDISANTEMIFMTMDAATELNESGLQNTQMVLVSMDALTEINEQLILLQEEVTKLKGGIL